MTKVTYCISIVVTLITITLAGCARTDKVRPLFDEQALEMEIKDFIADKDARIGVAVISDSGDTVSVNGYDMFPMLSVYKFPQALAAVSFCHDSGVALTDSVDIDSTQLHPDTYSPMREKYGRVNLRLPVSELLAYSVQESDNNACDILFDMIGGPAYVDTYIKGMGLEGIEIRWTEDSMHLDTNLCYTNCSTPIAMAQLLALFANGLCDSLPEYGYVAELMESCSTGLDRLPAPLAPEAIIGHKTGTGDRKSDGRIIGLNDVGYVKLANGMGYQIAIFVTDSNYDYDATAELIAEISRIVAENISNAKF